MPISLASLNGKSQAVLNQNCLAMLYLSGMSIGARIIKLRHANKPKKLSQEALGELCGVGKSAVSQWESGATEPDLTTLINLRKKLVFSLDWLLTGEGEMGMVYKADPLINHVVSAMLQMGKDDATRLANISDTLKTLGPNVPPDPHDTRLYEPKHMEEIEQPRKRKRK